MRRSHVRKILLAAAFPVIACAKAQAWDFIVAGDTRGASTADSLTDHNGVNVKVLGQIANAAVAEHAEFIAIPGDLALGSTNTATLTSMLTTWRDTMAPAYNAGIGVYAVRGNHDTGSLAAWNNVFTGQYAMPANGPSTESNLTWSITHKNVFFAGMDQYSINVNAVTNQAWLDKQLATNTSPFVFTMGHEPAFSVSHTDCMDDDLVARNTYWQNLMSSGSRVYFTGHDHLYNHALIGDGDTIAANDIHQVLAGAAGAPFSTWTGNYAGANDTFTPSLVYREENRYGYMKIQVGTAAAKMTWKHQNADGTFNADGTYPASGDSFLIRPVMSIRQTKNLYTDTVDTYISGVNPNTSYASSTRIVADGKEGSGTTKSQGLLKFNNLIGSGPRQIPKGAAIKSATLSLWTGPNANTGDNDQSVNTMYLYRIDDRKDNFNWDGNSTWNSLGDLTSRTVTSADGSVIPSTVGGVKNFNVTNSVQAWASGAANQGWAIIPTGTDGWRFNSSELPDPNPNDPNSYSMQRPTLQVTISEPASIATFALDSTDRGTIVLQGHNGDYDPAQLDIVNSASGHVGITGLGNDIKDGGIQVLLDLQLAGSSTMNDVLDLLNARAAYNGYSVEGVPNWSGSVPPPGWDVLLKFNDTNETGPFYFDWDFSGLNGVMVDRVAVVPEPSSLGLLCMGLMGLLLKRRRYGRIPTRRKAILYSSDPLQPWHHQVGILSITC